MSVVFLPGLGSMKTFACFRDAGQCSNLVTALNIWRRAFRPSGGSSFIIRAVIRSEPDALSGCSCLIACLSSLIVKARSFLSIGCELQVVVQLPDPGLHR